MNAYRQAWARGLVIGSAFAGAGLLALLLKQHGPEVWATVRAVRWALVPIVALHGIQLLLSGAAWHAVADPQTRRSGWTYLWVRWVREGVSGLLPVAQIGGDVIGARLLTLAGAPLANVAASLTVDLSIEAITLFAFVLTGIAFAVVSGVGGGLVGYSLIGMAALLPCVVLIVMLPRQSTGRFLERLGDWLAQRLPGLPVAQFMNVHRAIVSTYAIPGAFLQGCGYHLASWAFGIVEILVMATAIHAPISAGQALVFESIGQAVRAAAFFVPAGLGVQEGGLLLIALQLGLPGETGLALSLLKRVREVTLGVPALLAWYIAENHYRVDSDGAAGAEESL